MDTVCFWCTLSGADLVVQMKLSSVIILSTRGCLMPDALLCGKSVAVYFSSFTESGKKHLGVFV